MGVWRGRKQLTPALHVLLESLARACTEHVPRAVFAVSVERSRIAAADARTVAAQLLMQVGQQRTGEKRQSTRHIQTKLRSRGVKMFTGWCQSVRPWSSFLACGRLRRRSWESCYQ